MPLEAGRNVQTKTLYFLGAGAWLSVLEGFDDRVANRDSLGVLGDSPELRAGANAEGDDSWNGPFSDAINAPNQLNDSITYLLPGSNDCHAGHHIDE